MTDIPYLTLVDGTKVSTLDGKLQKQQPISRNLVEIPTNQEAIEQITTARRQLSDLPDTPKKMNLLAAVLSYKLFGLSDIDIAIAIDISEQQVALVQKTDAYYKLRDNIVSSIEAQDSDNVRSFFKKASKRAARKLEEFMESDNESIALSATKDILDRAGHTAAQTVQHQHTMQGGLEIVVRSTKDSNLIEGELTYE